MGGHSLLPLEIPPIDVPKVSYRIVHPRPSADTNIPFINSDQLCKHLNDYGYNLTAASELPASYIRWVQPPEEELERRCEYDMDAQDLEWLQTLNADRKRMNLEPVTCELFEISMDRLEKEWFQLNRRMQKPDNNLITSEDSRCAICEDGDTENSNAIVFCDGCNLAVHQDCYGVPYIPEGQWLCRKCTVSPDRPVTCELCPNSFGAFKQTSENKWAHLVCAVHIPETGVGNAMYMEPVDGVRCIPKQRWKLRCYICKKNVGACIQCSNRSCCVAYHVTCAQEFGLFVKLKPSGSLNPAPNSHGPDDGLESHLADQVGNESLRISQTFCDKHTPKGHIEALKTAAETRLAQINSSVSTESNEQTNAAQLSFDSYTADLPPQPDSSILTLPSKKISSLNDLWALKMLATGSQTSKSARAYRKSYFSGPPLVPQVIFQRLMEYSSKLRCAQRKVVLSMICKYWSLKREARRGAPLLKRLHLEPWTAANSVNHNNEEDRRRKYRLLTAVRHDLQQVKNLAAMVCKREKIKLRKAEIQQETIQKTLFPVYSRISHALRALIDADKQKYFLNPVSATEVPDYYDVIKHPMNWVIMQRKIDRFEYFRLSEFISDVHLTLTNARMYNHASTAYHKAAIRIGKAVEPLLRELVTAEPPSAIAGLSSKSFPTPLQTHHFLEIQRILSRDRIDELLDVKGASSLTSRSYDEVLQDRIVKKSRQTQANDLVVSTDLTCPMSRTSSHVELPRTTQRVASSVFQKALPLQHGRSGEATTNPSDAFSSSSFAITPPLHATATTLVTPCAHMSLGNKESLPPNEQTAEYRTKKRKDLSTEQLDSAIERPTKRKGKKAAQRTKPQMQLEEQASIEQQCPDISKGKLISLKLRAIHAERIAAREVGMSEKEKARRHRLREYIRRKRQRDAEARLTKKILISSVGETQQLVPPQPQEFLTNQSSFGSKQTLLMDQTSMNFCAELSCRAINDCTVPNIDDRPIEVLSEPGTAVKSEVPFSNVDSSEDLTIRVISPGNLDETVSTPPHTEGSALIADSTDRTSPPIHRDLSASFDKRMDDPPYLVAPVEPAESSSGTPDIELARCSSNQANNLQSIRSDGTEVTVLPSSVIATTAVTKADTEVLPGSKHHDHSNSSSDCSHDLRHVNLMAPLETEVSPDPPGLLDNTLLADNSKACEMNDEKNDLFDTEIPGSVTLESIPAHLSTISWQSTAVSAPTHQASEQAVFCHDNPLLVPGASLEEKFPHSAVSTVSCSQVANVVPGDEQTQEGVIKYDQETSPGLSIPHDRAEALDTVSSADTISLKINTETEAMTIEPQNPLAIIASLSSNVRPVTNVSFTPPLPLLDLSSAQESAIVESATLPSSPEVTSTKAINAPSSVGDQAFFEADSNFPPMQTDQHQPSPGHCALGFDLTNQLNDAQTDCLSQSSERSILAQEEPVEEIGIPCTPLPAVSEKYPSSNLGAKSVDKPVRIEQTSPPRKLTLRLRKIKSPAQANNNPPMDLSRISENSFQEHHSVPISHKLQLILGHSPPGPVPACETETSRVADSPNCQENVVHEKDQSRPKMLKSAANVVRPEFVNSLPGDKDSFRLFNTGFILPEGTRRHTAAPFSTSYQRQPSSPRMKQRKPRLSDPVPPKSHSLRPVRLTLIHNAQNSQASSSDTASSLITGSNPTSLGLSSSANSEYPGKASIYSHGESPNKPDVSVPIDKLSPDNPGFEPPANRTVKVSKKSKLTRAQQEKELEVDSRGFPIYPRATNNPSKNPVHPLAREAFRRLSQNTRLPEDASIPDGTLVWAKVPGHNWFPAEVGLPNHPLVPQSVLEKQFSGKLNNHLLVMFLDHQRSWQWVSRRNTRYFGESNELDALLSSEAYVANKSKLEEIQEGCALALSNMALPEDVVAEDEQLALQMLEQESNHCIYKEDKSTETWEPGFRCHKQDSNQRSESCETEDFSAQNTEVSARHLTQDATHDGKLVASEMKPISSRRRRALK